MAVNGKALAALGIGAIFVWSGVKGWSVTGTFRDIITGRSPAPSSVGSLTDSGSNSGGGVGTMQRHATGSAIADTAMQYQGHAYKFGGAPGKDASKPWDCSSMVNFVVGVKLGQAIPGYGPGKYDGSTHGPVTTQWGIWPQQHVKRAEVQAGDIIVWTGHMGIAINNKEMISAHSPATGTYVTDIDGHGNGPLMAYVRL